uniref:6-phosphogluconolactonase n=1 Tax=Culicoides sonorensis TaxID=179676 RepID=A0A336MJQ0_CULSO
MSPIILKEADESSVIKKLCELIETKANEAITSKGVFRVGLSGGSLTKYLSTGLPNIKTDFEKWQFFFCDERYVSESDPESTFGIYKSTLAPKISVDETQFFKIDQSLPLEECAKNYALQIRKTFEMEYSLEWPQFDLLLLGMGPDGHTCSLFPGHKLLEEKNMLIAPIDDSPKPPPCRVTMTYLVLNNAKCCIFAMAGSGKADMVKRILVDKEDLPAGRVLPLNGELYWIVDAAAGIHLE